MELVEWLVVAGFLTAITGAGLYCKRYVKSVADWLVAGRGCGRYLGATAGEAASLGAITIIAHLQAGFVAGPVYWWVILITVIVYMIIAISGWGIYRLRQTKVMTINELLERRYSRKLRIFCGMLCFVSGVLNMGIFPIVIARFIVYYCSFPLSLCIFGITMPTVFIVSALLVSIALSLAVFGGQVSLIVTDFLQWAVMMIMCIVVGIVVYRIVNWQLIGEAIMAEPEPRKYVDPFLPTAATSFGLWYCLMFSFRAFYNVLSWAPGSIRGQSATDARETKMMWILSYIRYGSNIGLLFAAVACFAFMRLPQFAEQAAAITTKVDLIDNSMVKSQMVVPLFLAYILPTGVKGLLLVGMISASISTLDTYFLSWAGVFAQDVFLPLTGKKFSQKQRLKLLKWSAAGVAFFVFLFSILWKETEYIHMYFAVTGSIYTGGAGAIILGALYWKNASTAGAWAAMFTGSAGAVGGIIARQLWSGQAWWPGWLNGMAISIAASVSAIIIFILVSMLTKVKSYDMKNLLRDE